MYMNGDFNALNMTFEKYKDLFKQQYPNVRIVYDIVDTKYKVIDEFRK